MPGDVIPRTQFGMPRSTCGCKICVDNCRYMPGFLIPDDLERLMDPKRPPYEWAAENLLASPGAIVKNSGTGEIFRIHTLVPKVKADGSCIHLTADNLCAIHENAPFGCAFFDCGPEPPGLARQGLLQAHDWFAGGMYGLLWRWLWEHGYRQKGPEILIQRARQEGANI